MMVGHAMLAFAIGTVVALWWSRERAPTSERALAPRERLPASECGQSRERAYKRALAFGVVAGAFAAVPDVDMLYAVVGLARVGLAGVWTMTDAFWGSSLLVHRAVTHSLVVGAIAAVAFTASVTHRTVSALLVAGLTAVAFAESGLLGGTIMFLFLVAGVVVTTLARRYTDLGSRELLAGALLGLLSHPFGDVFTGTPPQFFYPLDFTLFAERVTLLADPTLNLLAIFVLELATIWFAGYVYLRGADRSLRPHVDGRAAVGVAYAIAVIAMPAPTLDVSYHFVFSVLSLSVVGVAPGLHPARSLRAPDGHETLTWVLTGLAAVSIAALAYTLAYVFYPVF